ncbi:outer membrane protein assembly factor [Ilyomonas limi]|uniref:Outer membrane protein assembly factor n=1 Tax=Ilyomonas limi TaxID=2575867 RepID=A0A4U3KRK5_9BACT|nr:POTRA domain-containing protein [Ilyomonas limi]TKK64249.1 outer membrane protein assembly factor [Ilyomonas limi]
MQQVCRFLLLVVVTGFIYKKSSAQQLPVADSAAQTADTTVQPVTSVDADLLNIFNQKGQKRYKITGITVTGNRYFDQALLVSISGLTVGDEVIIPGGDNFAKAIQKLWSQNYFSNVEIYITRLEGDNIYIEIHVQERPRLADFQFKGVGKGEIDDLKTKSGLVKGRVITEAMKRSAIDAISKYYSDKGYRAVAVNISEKKDTSLVNSQVLVFNVDKGEKIKISDIYFFGNTVPDAKLKKQMKGTKEMTRLTLFPPQDSFRLDAKKYTFSDYLNDKGFLSFTKTKEVLNPYVRLTFASAKFNEKKYQEDKEKLIEYYNSLGYRDAVIVADNPAQYNSKGNLVVSVKLSEGHKYYFGNITWQGNTKYNDSLLTTILGIKKGDVYNLDLLNKKLGKAQSADGGGISDLYSDEGYLFFQANAEETAIYNDTIDYKIHIQEGPVATWKNVRISGNEKTKEYVIRRELRTLPGEKYSRSDIIRSIREIANLGFFNQEKITPTPVPNPEDGTVDINWQVEEKSSDQLELSAGFGGGIGLTGTLGVSFNNFSIKNIFHKEAWDPLPVGDGQKLSVRFQSNGRAYRSYNISFTEPWLGGKKRNSLSVGLYDTKYSNAYDYNPYSPTYGTYVRSKGDSSYFRTTGLSLGLGKQLKWPDDYFSFTTTLSYSRYKLKNYAISYNLYLKNDSIFNNGISNNLNIRFALQRSSVDAPIFPRSGSNFLMSLQLTPPWSLLDPNITTDINPYKWIEYHKWRFTGEWYVPLGRARGADKNQQFVLKAAAKYGFIGRYNHNLQISPFERFQLGDAGLSNSYALLGYDIISQRGYPVYENSNPKINPDQTGASQYFTIFNKYTLELRYPLSLNPSSTIYGLAFFEAANGWYNFKEYNPFQLRRSVGLGMRFYLPMFGLLGFDYGIGLDRLGPNTSLKDAGRFTFMLGYEPE